MQQPTKPIVIEEEPSHELYANLIGKNADNIIREPLSNLKRARGTNQVPQASSLSTIIPEENDDEAETSMSSSSTVTGRHSAKPQETRRKEHSKTNVYKKALSPNYNAPPLSQLSLDKKNKGFQMLARMGFREKDGGLGKDRQGTLTPMKTVLKLDRRGLGSGKRLVPKVTHKLNNDSLEGDGVKRKLSKAERKRLAKNESDREQLKAKKARMMIRSDLDDKYGVFLGL